MQLWFNFLGFFNTWLFKWCKVNCPCKLSLRTVILVGHSDLEFHQKLAYELGEFRIILVAQYLSLNNFLLAAWSQVWGSFLTAMSMQVKLGGLQFQQFPYLSLCVLHLLRPPPPVGFVLTISWHLLLCIHTESSVQEEKWEEEKWWNAGSSCPHSSHFLCLPHCLLPRQTS